jgi:hypothetical protein
MGLLLYWAHVAVQAAANLHPDFQIQSEAESKRDNVQQQGDL